MRAALELGPNAYDAHDNIIAGAAYLRSLYDRFGLEGALAAYNAGPGRYLDFLLRGRPLPRETVRYVGAVGPAVSASAAPPLQANSIATAPQPQRPSVFASIDASGEVIETVTPAATELGRKSTLAPQSAGLFATSWKSSSP
jgi:hypothetical protein